MSDVDWKRMRSIRHAKLTPGARLLALEIFDISGNGKGACWALCKTLAESLRYTEKQIRNLAKELESAGVIKTIRRGKSKFSSEREYRIQLAVLDISPGNGFPGENPSSSGSRVPPTQKSTSGSPENGLSGHTEMDFRATRTTPGSTPGSTPSAATLRDADGDGSRCLVEDSPSGPQGGTSEQEPTSAHAGDRAGALPAGVTRGYTISDADWQRACELAKRSPELHRSIVGSRQQFAKAAKGNGDLVIAAVAEAAKIGKLTRPGGFVTKKLRANVEDPDAYIEIHHPRRRDEAEKRRSNEAEEQYRRVLERFPRELAAKRALTGAVTNAIEKAKEIIGERPDEEWIQMLGDESRRLLESKISEESHASPSTIEDLRRDLGRAILWEDAARRRAKSRGKSKMLREQTQREQGGLSSSPSSHDAGRDRAGHAARAATPNCRPEGEAAIRTTSVGA